MGCRHQQGRDHKSLNRKIVGRHHVGAAEISAVTGGKMISVGLSVTAAVL
jgi:hypothetical protein